MSDQNDTNWGRYMGIGLEIAVGAGLGYFVGSWLDRKYNWHGNGTLVCVLCGVAAGMYLLIKDAIRMNKD
jgi:F0F1-type ATP synthase assembly protein I